MALIEDILERGRHNKRAISRIDSSGVYRFESYSYGINSYYRVCVALKAVYYNSSQTGDVYRAWVDDAGLPRTFRTERTCIAAIVKAAKTMEII